MAKIAYILLCHKDPDGVVAQTRALTEAGDGVAIHMDRSAPGEAFAALRASLSENPLVTFADRVTCGWGEWSLVQATLNGLAAARTAFPDATHFYLVSGDCVPIKSADWMHARLDADDADRIECVDFFTSGWIRTGFVEERLIYRHLFNERTQRRAYYAALALQERLGLKRKLPKGLKIRIGSQWWCLRRRTVDAVLDFIEARPDIVRFFRTTWIPDETFFQTIVRHLVPRDEIRSETPTFLMFSDYGMPVNFYNDHYDFLISQPEFFARKISPGARNLKERLSGLYASGQDAFRVTGGGRRLFAYTTGRGRVGQRFGARAWERDSALGLDRTLLLVACKKWHVARRFADQITFATNLPSMDFIFDEANAVLPDLGGIEQSLEKRSRHRRALIGLLFDKFGTDRLAICVDPANMDLMRDFYGDRCETRLMLIECDMSDDYLAGHARRVGLVGADAPGEVIRSLLPTLRGDVQRETAAIREEQFPAFYRLRQHGDGTENARAVADFLSVPLDVGRKIAETEHLYAD